MLVKVAPQMTHIISQLSVIIAQLNGIIAQPSVIIVQLSGIIAQPSVIIAQPNVIIAKSNVIIVQNTSTTFQALHGLFTEDVNPKLSEYRCGLDSQIIRNDFVIHRK